MATHLLFDVLHGKTEVTPENFEQAMQQAIEIEIATIPVYLYTYYSINRVPNQDDITADLTKRLRKTGMKKPQAEQKALEMSTEIMVFANKAGAMIVSVAVEEMLHMSLSSNVKQALVGRPELVDKSPAEWPAYLPGHEPPFPINRTRFSLEQLHTFLLIESPQPFVRKPTKATAIPYVTIGEFYAQIAECITTYYKDPIQYIEALPHDKIVQMHLAGHQNCGDYIIDTHDRRVIDPVWRLFRLAWQRTGGASTLLEWDSSIPDFDDYHAELLKARQFMDDAFQETDPAAEPVDADASVSNPVRFMVPDVSKEIVNE